MEKAQLPISTWKKWEFKSWGQYSVVMEVESGAFRLAPVQAHPYFLGVAPPRPTIFPRKAWHKMTSVRSFGPQPAGPERFRASPPQPGPDPRAPGAGPVT